MLRVTIEKLPSGYENLKMRLYVLEISNDGTGDNREGHYDVTLTRPNQTSVTARVRRHRRDQRNGALRLVKQALDAIKEVL